MVKFIIVDDEAKEIAHVKSLILEVAEDAEINSFSKINQFC